MRTIPRPASTLLISASTPLFRCRSIPYRSSAPPLQAIGADQGRSSGGQVSLITKSGSNQFHGSLYEYNRNTAITANNWFSNRAGMPRQALVRNQYGVARRRQNHSRPRFLLRKLGRAQGPQRDGCLSHCSLGNIEAGHRPVPLYGRRCHTNGQSVSRTGENRRILWARRKLLHVEVSAVVSGQGTIPLPVPMLGFNFSVLRFNSPCLSTTASMSVRWTTTWIIRQHTVSVRGTLAPNNTHHGREVPGQAAAQTGIDNSRGIAARYTAVSCIQLINNFNYGLTRLGNQQTGTADSSIALYFSTPIDYPPRTHPYLPCA